MLYKFTIFIFIIFYLCLSWLKTHPKTCLACRKKWFLFIKMIDITIILIMYILYIYIKYYHMIHIILIIHYSNVGLYLRCMTITVYIVFTVMRQRDLLKDINNWLVVFTITIFIYIRLDMDYIRCFSNRVNRPRVYISVCMHSTCVLDARGSFLYMGLPKFIYSAWWKT